MLVLPATVPRGGQSLGQPAAGARLDSVRRHRGHEAQPLP